MGFIYNTDTSEGTAGTNDGRIQIFGSGTLTKDHVYEILRFKYYEFQGNSVSPQSVQVMGGFTALGPLTFFDWNNLVSITFYDQSSITTLGNGVFKSCTSLSQLELPPKLVNVPAEMCEQCTVLGTIIIPATVRSVATGAFKNCSFLENITFSPGSQLVFLQENTFLNCIF
jgi:hypothetical protein